MRPGYYLEGRDGLDFTRYEWGQRTARLTMEVAYDPTVTAFAEMEAAHKKAGDLRFIRLRARGPAFAAPDDAFRHEAFIDGAYRHLDGSMQERGADRDGLLIVNMELGSALDAATASDVQITVQNALAAFPA